MSCFMCSRVHVCACLQAAMRSLCTLRDVILEGRQVRVDRHHQAATTIQAQWRVSVGAAACCGDVCVF